MLDFNMLLRCWQRDAIVPLSRTPLVSLAALFLACSVMAQAPISGQRGTTKEVSGTVDKRTVNGKTRVLLSGGVRQAG